MTRLDIFSDPVCPWCLIGKLELDAALAKRPDHPFSITWHPFRLNPQMPAKGMNRAEYLTAKFGENAASSQDAFLERAAQLGVTVGEQVASLPSKNQIERVVAPSPPPPENHNLNAHKWALQLLLLLILYLEHSGGRGSVCGFWGRAVVWGATIKGFS